MMLSGETYVNIANYGGCNGVDDDAALAEQLFCDNPGCTIFFPRGEYRLETTLNVPYGHGNRIKGESRQSAILNAYAENASGIKFDGNAIVGVGVEDIRINGVGERTAGYGIDIPNVVGNSYVRNVHAFGHWIGFGLGPTDFSYIENCISERNYSHGYHLRNRDGLAAASLQWVHTNNLAQLNDGSGFIYEGVPADGLSQASTGNITGCATFANSRYGMEFIGKANMKIQGVRLNNCFIGEDARAGVLLDTFGGQHVITGGFYEIAGSGKTGRLYATPKSGQGIGIQITGNNGIMNITGAHIGGNGMDGVLSEADYLTVTGCTIINNGLNCVPGRRNGVYHFGGRLNVSGGLIRNVQAGTLQQYGVVSVDGSNLRMTGVDLDGNAVGKYYVQANPGLAKISNC